LDTTRIEIILSNLRIVFLALLILSIITSCDKEVIENPKSDDDGMRDYIFLGHIYEDPTHIDQRLEAMDYSIYDQILLGGDICSETTQEISTLEYLDDIFNLNSDGTHWTWGNHDMRNGNTNYITNATNRPSFYSSYTDSVTFLVLNTTFGHSGTYDTTSVREQLQLITEVCDTIQQSTHLIVMTHHIVWERSDPNTNMFTISNGGGPGVLFDLAPNQKYDDIIYPMLTKVQERGVQVIHIAGDLGQKRSTYEYTTAEGIHLLGSGITSDTDYHSQFPTHGIPDSILILHHDMEMAVIEWKFVELD